MLPCYTMGWFTSLHDNVNWCLPRGQSYIMFLSKITVSSGEMCDAVLSKTGNSYPNVPERYWSCVSPVG